MGIYSWQRKAAPSQVTHPLAWPKRCTWVAVVVIVVGLPMTAVLPAAPTQTVGTWASVAVGLAAVGQQMRKKSA
ncbi:hypothetical protein [Kitasatospora sp. NPDC093679]|uniref:hypothetical protein n=1 Tax=Kitasatospora sp. NPDC093679 TaxID=3154983 RepID=UPI00343BEF42